MELRTYTDIITKLNNDYDLTDENFISETELLGYLNEAIDDAEAIVHNLHHEDKYFLTRSTFSWVSGTQDYALPTDIYSNKIRVINYNDGTEKYEIRRLKDLKKIPFLEATDPYQYLIINTTASGVRARFYPTPAITNSTYVEIWYIRNMLRMTTSAASTNVCEVPESVNFIYQHCKKNIAKKMRRPDLIAQEESDLKMQYDLLLSNLKDMTADDNTVMEMDLSSYWEQQGGF